MKRFRLAGDKHMMAMQVVLHGLKSKMWQHAFVVLALAIIPLLSVSQPFAASRTAHIVAFGDSLTAGYGLPPGADFASRLEKALAERGLNVRVSNAGVSGDTTSGGLARFDWAVPADTDAVILELGANDALRGIPPKIARDNLDQILSKLANRKIPVLLAGMRAPTNWGDAYTAQFDAIFTELAQKHGALLYAFFLEGVIDMPKLKLPDALHPNQAGVDEIVKRILPTVEELIKRIQPLD